MTTTAFNNFSQPVLFYHWWLFNSKVEYAWIVKRTLIANRKHTHSHMVHLCNIVTQKTVRTRGGNWVFDLFKAVLYIEGSLKF